MYSGLTGTLYPMLVVNSTSATIVANFGATAMTYTAPSGYNQ